MYKIAVIGHGYVGKGVTRLFGDWVSFVVDPAPPSDTKYQQFSDVSEVTDFFAKHVDLVVICVPTAQNEDGSCDTTIVEQVSRQVVEKMPQANILIKSTVKPGTTQRLSDDLGVSIVFSPEYMGEGKYFVPPWKYPDPVEMKMHSFQIFGGDPSVTQFMVDVFTKKMGPHVTYMQTDSKTAEVVKYMENSWGAMKVIFANEWYDICVAHGVDYRTVRELWALDSRVEKMHTAVFPKSRGYGGKCFPKDISAIIESSQERGYNPVIMETVQMLNKVFNEKSEE